MTRGKQDGDFLTEMGRRYEEKTQEVIQSVKTRRAPHMEQYVRVRPYLSEANPEGHKVELMIGVQGFNISDGFAGH